MRSEIVYYLDEQPDLKYFIRMHPDWYRRLSRHPADFSILKKEADEFLGKTFSKRLEKLNEQVTFLSMLMEMAAISGQDDNDGEAKDSVANNNKDKAGPK